MLTPIPTDESNSVNVLQNGITSILEAIHNLIPAWGTTASHLNTSVQSVNQLATTTAQSVAASANISAAIMQMPQPQIYITINPKSIPLPNEYKGLRDKAADFLQACNQYFAQAEVTRDEVKIAMALALMKGDKTSKWSENQLELIQEGKTDVLTNWAQFQQSFKDQFGDCTPQETAAAKI
ncbi:hypothetical protein C0989_006567 [Termitomyces sp. Mn162]|nr:hypothetical protein C0989_006567 [Termitomyces sp. Mn162]